MIRADVARIILGGWGGWPMPALLGWYNLLMPFPLPQRILLGPGPSIVDPRVYRAMSAPVTGHMDPTFLALMKEVRDKLRRVFRAHYEVTIPISGTGSAGMEAALVNFI